MKRLIAFAGLLLLLAIAKPCQSQALRASAGGVLFASKSFETSLGANLGIGFGNEKFTGGLNFDIFEFDSKKRKYTVISADVKAYLHQLTESITPFVAFQPGFVVYSATVYSAPTKGNIAFALLGGIRLKQEDNLVGGVLSIGYSNISLKTDHITHYGGLKIVLGITL